MNAMNNLQKYAPIILRLGLSLVFLWFGFNQVFNPEMFLGYMPNAVSMPMHQFMSQHHLLGVYSVEQASLRLISFNGIIELVFGTLLLLGIFTRVVAVVLLIHLLTIAASLGYNDVMIRDLGLSIALLSIIFYGTDDWCVEKKWRK